VYVTLRAFRIAQSAVSQEQRRRREEVTDDNQMLRRGLVLDLAVAFGTYRDVFSWIERDMSKKRRTVDESDMNRTEQET